MKDDPGSSDVTTAFDALERGVYAALDILNVHRGSGHHSMVSTHLFEQARGIVLRRLELPGVVRVSLGIENSEEDVDTLIHVLGGIARQPKDGASEKAVRQQMDDSCKASARRVYVHS